MSNKDRSYSKQPTAVQESHNIMTGNIKHISKEKGFGFIRAENGTEYFFHRSGMVDQGEFDSLVQDQTVRFEPQTSAKGPRAEQIQVV